MNYIKLLRLTAVDDLMTGAHRLRCDTCRKWFAYWIDVDRVFDDYWSEGINQLCRQHIEASPKCKYLRLKSGAKEKGEVMKNAGGKP